MNKNSVLIWNKHIWLSYSFSEKSESCGTLKLSDQWSVINVHWSITFKGPQALNVQEENWNVLEASKAL